MAKKTAKKEEIVEETKEESKPKTVMKMIGGRMREIEVQ